MARERIDRLMVRLGLAETRSTAQALLMEGRVRVDGLRVDKAGALIREGARIEVAGPPRLFVSRGGLKLEAALHAFGLNAEGARALDVGAGTGGFTDCLLKRGAERVYALDVGRGQLDQRLRNDPRVTVIEGLNARFLSPEDLPSPVDLVAMDVSFISANLILPRLPALMEGHSLVLLVKPQFEVGRQLVGKGGIVRDPASWRKALESVAGGASQCGFRTAGIIPSPITGAAGNVEFLAHLCLSGTGDRTAALIDAALDAAPSVARGPGAA